MRHRQIHPTICLVFCLTSVALSQSRDLSDLKAKAESGDPKSQVELGIAYAAGDGVPANDAEAVRWFRKAAERGNADGEYSLGEMYTTGRGVKKDYKKAAEWMQKAADQGDLRAITNMGAMYLNGLGVRKDEKRAFQLTKQAADQGFAPAEFGLGLMYARGHGTERDRTEALKWYENASDHGDAPAMNNLAWLLATADKREDRDPRKAVELAVRATTTSQEHVPEYLDTLATTYYANRQFSEALKAEQKALALKPKDKAYQQLVQNYGELAKLAPDVPEGFAWDELTQSGPGVTKPKPVFTPDPEPSADGLHGKVVISGILGSDGRVYAPRVDKSLRPDLDGQALDTIRQWIFQPARKDGRPVAVRLNVELTFFGP